MTAADIYRKWCLDPTLRSTAATQSVFSEVHSVCRQLFGDRLNARYFAMRLSQMKDRQRNGRVLVSAPPGKQNIARYKLEAAANEPPIKKASPRADQGGHPF